MGMLSTAHAGWELARYEDQGGSRQHISVTGMAEGWLDTHGHPKLRASCVSGADGSDLYLSFHFPAAHSFMAHSSNHEPVSFKVHGTSQGDGIRETVQYLSLSDSQQNVFRTLLASDGVSSTINSGKLLLDLHHGQYLDVQFIQQSQPYRVQYSLKGFFEQAAELMQSCRMSGYSYSDLGSTWEDYIKIVEVAGVLAVKPPAYGAARPANEVP